MERHTVRSRRAISYCRLKLFTELHKDTSAIDNELIELSNELSQSSQLKSVEDSTKCSLNIKPKLKLSFNSVFNPPTANLQVVLADKALLQKKLKKASALNLRLARRLRASHGLKQRVRKLTWLCSQKDSELERLRKQLEREQAKTSFALREGRSRETWSLRPPENPFEASLDRSIEQLLGLQTADVQALSTQLSTSKAQAATLLARTQELEEERDFLKAKVENSVPQTEFEKLQEENQYLKESCELLLKEQEELLEMDNMIQALESDVGQAELGNENQELTQTKEECKTLQHLADSLKQELAAVQQTHNNCLQQRHRLEAQVRRLEGQLTGQATERSELSPKRSSASPS